MKFKELKRSAHTAWCSAPSADMILVSATAECNYIDPQISSHQTDSPSLEFFRMNLEDNVFHAKPDVILKTNHRSTCISWSPPVSDLMMGLLISGTSNGSLYLYNPEKMLDLNQITIEPSQFDSSKFLLNAKENAHIGIVRCLDFNKFQFNLFASVSDDSEIFIWDIEKMEHPMSPGSKLQPTDKIIKTSWNPRVQHILCTTSSECCVIWDLRKSDPVVQLSKNICKLEPQLMSWSPDVATRLCLTDPHHVNSEVQLWDLRYPKEMLACLCRWPPVTSAVSPVNRFGDSGVINALCWVPSWYSHGGGKSTTSSKPSLYDTDLILMTVSTELHSTHAEFLTVWSVNKALNSDQNKITLNSNLPDPVFVEQLRCTGNKIFPSHEITTNYSVDWLPNNSNFVSVNQSCGQITVCSVNNGDDTNMNDPLESFPENTSTFNLSGSLETVDKKCEFVFKSNDGVGSPHVTLSDVNKSTSNPPNTSQNILPESEKNSSELLKIAPKWMRVTCKTHFAFGGRLVSFSAESSSQHSSDMNKLPQSIDHDSEREVKFLVHISYPNLDDQPYQGITYHDVLNKTNNSELELMLKYLNYSLMCSLNHSNFQHMDFESEFVGCFENSKNNFYDLLKIIQIRSNNLESIKSGLSNLLIPCEQLFENKNENVGIDQSQIFSQFLHQLIAALFSGDLSTVVNLCLQSPIDCSNSTSVPCMNVIALILASHFNQPELYSKVQSTILNNLLKQNLSIQSVPHNIINSLILIINSILTNDWSVAVKSFPLKYWSALFLVLINYLWDLNKNLFNNYCDCLANRLMDENNSECGLTISDAYRAACVCFIMTGNVDSFTMAWLHLNKLDENYFDVDKLLPLAVLLIFLRRTNLHDQSNGVISQQKQQGEFETISYRVLTFVAFWLGQTKSGQSDLNSLLSLRMIDYILSTTAVTNPELNELMHRVWCGLNSQQTELIKINSQIKCPYQIYGQSCQCNLKLNKQPTFSDHVNGSHISPSLNSFEQSNLGASGDSSSLLEIQCNPVHQSIPNIHTDNSSSHKEITDITLSQYNTTDVLNHKRHLENLVSQEFSNLNMSQQSFVSFSSSTTPTISSTLSAQMGPSSLPISHVETHSQSQINQSMWTTESTTATLPVHLTTMPQQNHSYGPGIYANTTSNYGISAPQLPPVDLNAYSVPPKSFNNIPYSAPSFSTFPPITQNNQTSRESSTSGSVRAWNDPPFLTKTYEQPKQPILSENPFYNPMDFDASTYMPSSSSLTSTQPFNLQPSLISNSTIPVPPVPVSSSIVFSNNSLNPIQSHSGSIPCGYNSELGNTSTNANMMHPNFNDCLKSENISENSSYSLQASQASTFSQPPFQHSSSLHTTSANYYLPPTSLTPKNSFEGISRDQNYPKPNLQTNSNPYKSQSGFGGPNYRPVDPNYWPAAQPLSTIKSNYVNSFNAENKCEIGQYCSNIVTTQTKGCTELVESTVSDQFMHMKAIFTKLINCCRDSGGKLYRGKMDDVENRLVSLFNLLSCEQIKLNNIAIYHLTNCVDYAAKGEYSNAINEINLLIQTSPNLDGISRFGPVPIFNHCPTHAKDYCKNGGECFYISGDPNIYMCSCFMPFYGPQCEYKAPESEVQVPDNKEQKYEELIVRKSVDRAMTITALIFIVITFLGMLILAWYISRRRRQDYNRWKKLTDYKMMIAENEKSDKSVQTIVMEPIENETIQFHKSSESLNFLKSFDQLETNKDLFKMNKEYKQEEEKKEDSIVGHDDDIFIFENDSAINSSEFRTKDHHEINKALNCNDSIDEQDLKNSQVMIEENEISKSDIESEHSSEDSNTSDASPNVIQPKSNETQSNHNCEIKVNNIYNTIIKEDNDNDHSVVNSNIHNKSFDSVIKSDLEQVDLIEKTLPFNYTKRRYHTLDHKINSDNSSIFHRRYINAQEIQTLFYPNLSKNNSSYSHSHFIQPEKSINPSSLSCYQKQIKTANCSPKTLKSSFQNLTPLWICTEFESSKHLSSPHGPFQVASKHDALLDELLHRGSSDEYVEHSKNIIPKIMKN